MIGIGPIFVFAALAGLTLYLVCVSTALRKPLPTPDYAETNVRIWCEKAGLAVCEVRRAWLFSRGHRVPFRVIVENELGERGVARILSTRDRLDTEADGLSVRWERILPPRRRPSDAMAQNDPLWDHSIDGGFTGRPT